MNPEAPVHLDQLTPPAAAVRSGGRWSTQRRNALCIWVIVIGMLNFLVYTVSYAALGGDAHNGERRLAPNGAGQVEAKYYVRGHFIRYEQGRELEVSAAAWIYSYAHSISVPVTSAAMIISMLVLARPHIIATMRNSWLSGQTFVVVFGVTVIGVSAVVTLLLTYSLIAELVDAQ